MRREGDEAMRRKVRKELIDKVDIFEKVEHSFAHVLKNP
jgi:hypothetical protein